MVITDILECALKNRIKSSLIIQVESIEANTWALEVKYWKKTFDGTPSLKCNGFWLKSLKLIFLECEVKLTPFCWVGHSFSPWVHLKCLLKAIFSLESTSTAERAGKKTFLSQDKKWKIEMWMWTLGEGLNQGPGYSTKDNELGQKVIWHQHHRGFRAVYSKTIDFFNFSEPWNLITSERWKYV